MSEREFNKSFRSRPNQKKLGKGNFGIQKRNIYLDKSMELERFRDDGVSKIRRKSGGKVSESEILELKKGLQTMIIAGHREKEHKKELRRLELGFRDWQL